MKVLWLLGTRAGAMLPTADLGVISGSPLASDRLRVACPAAALAAYGVQSEFCSLGHGIAPPDPAGYDVIVIGKFSSPASFDPSRGELWASFVEQAVATSRRVVLDVSDNPFSAVDTRTALYERILPLCSAVTVPSESLARVLAGRCQQAPHVVNDPYEGRPMLPRFAPSEPLRLLWFGHQANFIFLQQITPGLIELAREHPVALHIVTGKIEDIERTLTRLSAQYAPRFTARYTPWSLAAMERALQDCDVVLIPSDPGDPRKNGASTNRLVETLVAGRLPAASPLESYRAYAAYAVIRSDIVEGVREALRDPATMAQRILAGQQEALKRHAPDTVAREWVEALG